MARAYRVMPWEFHRLRREELEQMIEDYRKEVSDGG